MQRTNDGDQSLRIGFMVVSLLFTMFSIVFVLLRSYTKVKIKRDFGWDDGVIIIALVSSCIEALAHADLS